MRNMPKIQNEVTVSLSWTSVRVIFSVLAKLQAEEFLRIPLREITNVNCLIALISSLELSVEMFQDALGTLEIYLKCISCTSPQLNELSYLLESPEADSDLENFAEFILDAVSAYLESDEFQLIIDEFIKNSRDICPLYTMNDMNGSISRQAYTENDTGFFLFYYALFFNGCRQNFSVR